MFEWGKQGKTPLVLEGFFLFYPIRIKVLMFTIFIESYCFHYNVILQKSYGGNYMEKKENLKTLLLELKLLEGVMKDRLSEKIKFEWTGSGQVDYYKEKLSEARNCLREIRKSYEGIE